MEEEGKGRPCAKGRCGEGGSAKETLRGEKGPVPGLLPLLSVILRALSTRAAFFLSFLFHLASRWLPGGPSILPTLVSLLPYIYFHVASVWIFGVAGVGVPLGALACIAD